MYINIHSHSLNISNSVLFVCLIPTLCAKKKKLKENKNQTACSKISNSVVYFYHVSCIVSLITI